MSLPDLSAPFRMGTETDRDRMPRLNEDLTGREREDDIYQAPNQTFGAT